MSYALPPLTAYLMRLVKPRPSFRQAGCPEIPLGPKAQQPSGTTSDTRESNPHINHGKVTGSLYISVACGGRTRRYYGVRRTPIGAAQPPSKTSIAQKISPPVTHDCHPSPNARVGTEAQTKATTRQTTASSISTLILTIYPIFTDFKQYPRQELNPRRDVRSVISYPLDHGGENTEKVAKRMPCGSRRGFAPLISSQLLN